MKKLDPMHSPGEIRDCNPGEPVDDPQDGEDRDAQPPEPEDQKVLLVEEVVREDAKVVAPVYASGCSSNTDIARHLNTTFLIFHFFFFNKHTLPPPPQTQNSDFRTVAVNLFS